MDAVFDGEIVAVDEKGRPDFQALQNSMRSGEGRILYYVFDVLYAGGIRPPGASAPAPEGHPGEAPARLRDRAA